MIAVNPPQERTIHFSETDQLSFSKLSGDYNPVHLDARVASREMFGERIVHGIHILLKSWNLAAIPLSQVHKLEVKFFSPLFLNTPYHVQIGPIENSIQIIKVIKGQAELCRIRMEMGSEGSSSQVSKLRSTRTLLDFKTQEENPTWEEICKAKGTEPMSFDEMTFKSLFPDLDSGSSDIVAYLLALTRIIGMRVPGRQSLFSSFSLKTKESTSSNQNEDHLIHFCTKSSDSRFKMLSLETETSKFVGSATCFVRPHPQIQPDCLEIKSVVMRSPGLKIYHGQDVLVVGGTRGLGEVTAKLLAMSGARVIITYYKNQEEACRVVKEIHDHGGWAVATAFGLGADNEIIDLMRQYQFSPRFLCYFASPKIFQAKKYEFFNNHLFENFSKVYIADFFKLYIALRGDLLKDQHVKVLWPSSSALDECPDGMLEYAMAKAAQETFARFWQKSDKNITIAIPRFGRIATDQTLTLQPVPAEKALTVMTATLEDLALKDPL